MILLPAIDLAGGRCVRLTQGDFARETAYGSDPAAAIAGFAEQGAVEAHVVDLDGARARAPRQHHLLAALAAATPMKLQVAGGFRTAAHVAAMLDAGVDRVVIGSLAAEDPVGFDGLLDRFGPERLVLALDVKLDGETPLVATQGWTRISRLSLDAMLARFSSIRHLIVTDIERDGMLSGPNLALTGKVTSRYPAIKLQASGGVASLADLSALREAGAARAIVGKAIWERRFTVVEGLAGARG